MWLRTEIYSMLCWTRRSKFINVRVVPNDLSCNKFLNKTLVHGGGLHSTDGTIRNIAWGTAAYRHNVSQVQCSWEGSRHPTRTRACECVQCKVYWCVDDPACRNECKLQTAATFIITAVHLCGLSRAYNSRFIVHISTFPNIDFRWIIFAFLHCSTAFLAFIFFQSHNS
jgi:hypothetical protein